MLLEIYKIAMQASTPLLEAFLQKRLRRGKEDALRAPERRGIAARSRGSLPLVWFHAASVGESMALLAIISRLLDDNTGIEVLVTTGTVTSAQLMAERLPARAFHQYMPVDHPAWVEKFLAHWHPDLVIWSESEFWPNMLAAIKRRAIPAVLLNARMSEDSFRRWKWARGMIAEILSTFTLCLGQNAAEAGRLTALGAKDARISANMKYAGAKLPADEAALAKLKADTAGRPVVVYASTHAGEEEIALDTHTALVKQFPQMLTVIVPRHPQRGAEILALAGARGVTASVRSRNEPFENVYIADTLGELGLFFRLGNIIVMGGSFADIGGHNPIEPGQLGCIIVYGPQMYNFVTISADFLAAKAALQVADTATLQSQLSDIISRPADFASYGISAEKMTAEKSTVLDDLAAILQPYVARLGEKAAA